MRKNIKFFFLISLLAIFILPTKVIAQNATNEGESVLQKIKEKVETIRQNPKAFIGTVTDKTESSLQIKDLVGKIQQISVKENVTIVKTGKTNTDVKFSDVAIGDYIVALGLSSGNGVLDAKRILLTNPIEDPKRKVVFAKITKIQNKEITVSDTTDGESSYTFPKRWKGPEIKDLEEGTSVLIVALTDSDKPTIRTIEIININPSPAGKPMPSSSK